MAKFEQATTPKGAAIYPRVNEPDTKFDPEGEYKVDIRVPQADAQEFIDKIEAQATEKFDEVVGELKKAKKTKQAKEYKKHLPFEYEEDDDENLTGYVIIKAKQKAVGFNKAKNESWTNSVGVFDAKGKPTKAKVGGGSTLKMAVELVPFDASGLKLAGMTLRLKAVQVIELVEFGGKSAAGFGFGVEEGFEDDGSFAPAEETTPTSTDGGEDGEEDEGETDF